MIDYELDADGIATLAWTMPERHLNLISPESFAAFQSVVERVMADEAVRGVIITSAKDSFIAGADLEALLQLTEPAEILATIRPMQQLYRIMETCGKPFIAALNGSTLGGGLELALACHYRLAADRSDAQFGLPEVTLGLLPGTGGTQRLPRMLGVRPALGLLLEGNRLDPNRAYKTGLIDGVVPAEELLTTAKHWLLEEPKPVRPWDQEGYQIPDGPIQSPNGYQTFMANNAKVRARTWGNYPAPLAISSCVFEGGQLPIDVGLRVEARYFTQLLHSKVARSLVQTLFFGRKRADRLPHRPAEVPPFAPSKVAVLGAGLMGSGIACVSALAGLDVVLLDVSQERAEHGKEASTEGVARQVRRGRLSEAERDATVARIRPTADYTELAGAELIVEAVVEDRAIKAEVIRKAEAVAGSETVFASNTSTLPITGLAEASTRPEHFVGLHFFSPVERMPLVEVIRGEQSSRTSLARAMDYVRRIGKTPIVVNDSRGFYTTRVFATYVMEGLALLTEGVKPALIENTGCLAGMPLGPLAVADEVGLELLHHIKGQAQADLGDSYVESPGDAVITWMVERFGRLGKRQGQGFYDYPNRKNSDGKHLWPGLSQHFPVSQAQPSVIEVERRLLHIQALEAVRCLEEGVITEPRDADVGSVLGWGFAPFTGGVISYIDWIGVGEFAVQCQGFEATYGQRFTPPALLLAKAKEGERFSS